MARKGTKLDDIEKRLTRLENLYAESEDEMEEKIEHFVETPGNIPAVAAIALMMLGGIPLVGWIFTSVMSFALGNRWFVFGFPIWPTLVFFAGIITLATWHKKVKK